MSTDLILHSLLLFSLRKNKWVYLYVKRKIVYLYFTFIYFTKKMEVFTIMSASEKNQSIIVHIFYEKYNNVPIKVNYPLKRRRRRKICNQKIGY